MSKVNTKDFSGVIFSISFFAIAQSASWLTQILLALILKGCSSFMSKANAQKTSVVLCSVFPSLASPRACHYSNTADLFWKATLHSCQKSMYIRLKWCFPSFLSFTIAQSMSSLTLMVMVLVLKWGKSTRHPLFIHVRSECARTFKEQLPILFFASVSTSPLLAWGASAGSLNYKVTSHHRASPFLPRSLTVPYHLDVTKAINLKKK